MAQAQITFGLAPIETMLRIDCPDVLADAGYQGVDKRNPGLEGDLARGHAAMRPDKCKALRQASERAACRQRGSKSAQIARRAASSCPTAPISAVGQVMQ